MMPDKTLVEGYWKGDTLIGSFLMVKKNGNCFIGEEVDKQLKGIFINYKNLQYKFQNRIQSPFNDY